MNKYLFLLAFICSAIGAKSQCLTNSLIINTGYNPITATAVTPGVNGGTPVPDPKWLVSYETPSIATAIALTGLIEVVPGFNANVITTLSGWISDPFPTPGGWISCINSNTYNSDGTGPSGTVYSMTLTRPFKMCVADSIKFDLYIANDNYIGATDIDGVPFGFSQPAAPTTTNFTSFTHYTQTVYLSAGIHNFNVFSFNYNTTSVSPNPTGINIYGTVSSAGLLNSLVSESYLSCASYTCSGTCNAVDVPDTLKPCAGDVITIPGTITGSDTVLSILWSPIAGLSSSTVISPTLTVGTASFYYTVTVKSLIPFNLVSNGDFSAGNVGFTSSYTYAPPPSTTLIEGNYSVYTDPFGVHTGFTSMGDHTTGTGSMMILNGGPTPTDVWCETIPVTPNTDYDFSAWIANCSSVTVIPNVPILQFKINGVLIGTPYTVTSTPGVWTNFFSVWNSGVNTTATICIYDANTTAAGNDFALDDISFKEICVAKDSVYIAIKAPDTTTTRSDTTLCVSFSPIALNGTPGYTSYLWSTGSTATSILAGTSGLYWVYNNQHCATKIDTFRVTYIPLPTLSLGPDVAFCIGDSLVLQSIQPPGTSYLWSTGSTIDSIHVLTSGTYWLQVNNGCVVSDTVHVLISPFPNVDLGPDQFNCLAKPDTLKSLVSYTAPTYLWNSGQTTDTIIVPTTGTYWLQVTVAGCANTDTIHVTILYDTFTLANNDTAICRGKSVQTFLTANPAATFQWLPTAGILASTSASPMITPDTTAKYFVHIMMAGCPDIIDSFLIDVQPNPTVYIGGGRSVCQFDTLHLHALVSPQWYSHYIFDWTPGTFLDDSTVSDIVFNPGAGGAIKLVVTTPAGCMGADSGLLVVHPGNFATYDTSFNLCPGDSVQFTPTGGVKYIWHPGMYLSDSTSSRPWVHANTTQNYTAIAVSQFNCLDTIKANVIVHPAAVLNLGDSLTLYPGESHQIHTQTNCSRFAWFPPAGLNNAFISDPVLTPEISTLYKVTGTTEWGCVAVDSLSVFIDIASVINIPNAFTPGSTINSKLYLMKRGVASLNYFRIFNRWGNRVYESTDINQGWDGNFNDKPQPYDVYIYQVEAVGSDGKTFHKAGNVTLIR